MRATARAHPNFALSKYWGKLSAEHNLPAVPSLSLTLAGLATTTTVELGAEAGEDCLLLDGARAGAAQLRRVTVLADAVWPEPRRPRVSITSDNDFPTAAGLASSAAAFAALAVAINEAGGCGRSRAELSDLARRASASAGRSIYGGFVELPAGELSTGATPWLPAVSVAPVDHWDLAVIVAVTAAGPKAVGSTEGMNRTAATSPLYQGWVAAAPAIHARVRDAVLRRDFGALAEAAEHSALTMHAVAMAAEPPLLYWNEATLAVISAVRRLRAEGLDSFFTVDAGPHVKVLTPAPLADEVSRRLRATAGVQRLLVGRPGPGAHVVARAEEGPS